MHLQLCCVFIHCQPVCPVSFSSWLPFYSQWSPSFSFPITWIPLLFSYPISLMLPFSLPSFVTYKHAHIKIHISTYMHVTLHLGSAYEGKHTVFILCICLLCFVCVYTHEHMYEPTITYVEIWGQPVESSSLIPPCRCWGSNTDFLGAFACWVISRDSVICLPESGFFHWRTGPGHEFVCHSGREATLIFPQLWQFLCMYCWSGHQRFCFSSFCGAGFQA